MPPPDPDSPDDRPAPTPRQLAGLLWRVLWPVVQRLLWIAGLVLIGIIVSVMAGQCGK